VTPENAIPDPLWPPAGERWLLCDGRQLCLMFRAGLATLDRKHKYVNDLNVFPVPDGDTGTNMLLTMQAALKQIAGYEDKSVGKVAQAVSQGALMGARGNSGVILSQIWRGLARSLTDNEVFNTSDLADAFTEASETAYKGVMRPVEGTLLTVIREAAEEARDAASKSKDLRFMLARILERSQQALARTPDMLPVLKEAGVVDAGGQGLVYIIEGMLLQALGEFDDMVTAPVMAAVPAQAIVAPAEGLENPYDVQFILSGRDMDVFAVRNAIDAMGDSTLVVGDETTIKVHIHVKDPGQPISYGVSVGSISDVVVENMQLQMEEIITAPVTRSSIAAATDQIGVVAVAAGDGLAEIFRSAGASGIVDGGQSQNPSTEEILRVVEDLPMDRIIILPNNKNIILAAEAARDLSSKQVAVVPTRTIPQGISALLALDKNAGLDESIAAMTDAYSDVTSGQIAVATRSAKMNGVSVAEGDIIGVAEGRLCAAHASIGETLRHVLNEMALDERELLSIIYGQEVSEAEAEEIAAQVEALYPHLEVELLSGGQAIYQYILGAE
jgi:DAK2 domain fusion protein YloV